MKRFVDTLSVALQNELADIRSWVQKIGGNPADPSVQGEQILLDLENWLLDDEQKQMLRLNPWDIFLLYASAYLFDPGTMSNSGCLPDATDPVGDTGSQVLYSRGSSGQRSHDAIMGHWREIGIRDASVAAVVADVCRDVWRERSDGASTITVFEHVIDGSSINISLLSAAIRLSMELNLKAAAPSFRIHGFLDLSEPMPPENYDRSFTVTGVGPHPYLPGTIQVKVGCRHGEIHRALKHHERTVQRLLDSVNREAQPRFLFSDVIYEIQSEGYEAVDLKFAVDSTAALQLFTGNRLYSDNRVFLRELIQNAVDACNLRGLIEDAYVPEISISFNDDISIIKIRDNGIGMDRQWIEKYFLKIGISLYQSREIRSGGTHSQIGLNFISQFGIGFLSSFLVAEKIVIKTQRNTSSRGLCITITDLRNYFEVRRLEKDFQTGTEVTLHLRKSKINLSRSLEYLGYLKTNIRFLDLPLLLYDENGNTTVIGDEKLSYEDPTTAHIDFVASLNFSSSHGYLLLRAIKHGKHILAVDSALGGVSVFQDGIFVKQVKTLLPEAARGNVVGRINLRGSEKCALSMDRNRIFWTDEQLVSIKKIVRHGLVSAINRFMAAVQAQNSDISTQRSIVNHLSSFIDFNEVDDDMHHRLCDPIQKVIEKRFRDFVRVNFAHTLKSKGVGEESAGYSESWQQGILKTFVRN